MATFIAEDEMYSDLTAVRCTFRPGAAGGGAWTCTGLPGLLDGMPLNRNAAITAMMLAERLAAGYGEDDPFVQGWRDELG